MAYVSCENSSVFLMLLIREMRSCCFFFLFGQVFEGNRNISLPLKLLLGFFFFFLSVRGEKGIAQNWNPETLSHRQIFWSFIAE